jgi:uncharacterized protein (DUF58 family)
VILPSRRWLAGAAGLALVAPLALAWPPAALWLVALDVAWLAALAVDGWRALAIDATSFEVARDGPPAFSVGRALPVTYRWRSRLVHRATVRVEEELPAPLTLAGGPGRTLRLAPSTTLVEQHDVRPVARGRAASGLLHLRVSSPWGLAWRPVQLPLPWDVTVYPVLAGAALRALPTQVQRRREAGQRAVRRLGEGRVFESLREWVPGDDTRAIDWKATARRGLTMVRQFEDERRQHLIIAIDAGRLMTAEHEGRARLEFVVEAALQLAHAAVDHDDDVGLLVFSDEVHHWIAPARGRRALRAVLDVLAGARGRMVEPDYPAAFAFLAQRNRRRALTVLFTDIIDLTASDALVAHFGSLRARHLPLAVALRDPDLDRLTSAHPHSAAAAFERAAAEELLEAREGALAALRRRGVLVLDVPPAGAAEAVVAQYEALKRRGAL